MTATPVLTDNPRYRFLRAAFVAPFRGTALIALCLALLSLLFGPTGLLMAFLAVIIGFVWGLPFFILVGLPAFWFAARTGATKPAMFAAAGFLANLLGAAMHHQTELLLGLDGVQALLTLLIGGLVAPIWGTAFGRAYLRQTEHSNDRQ